ncbi:hypothetical protein A3C37_02355 [Candidatus Peribacteria bacterium RIFCSPHIGHO2_02_FULL_53_20]|nr:MAG: hypothetical protein A3C37_02355 [Candidatus Peribacteria bacterium RIFCSPHIGHO2_02_FULL_53_20]OGJ70104.1 MAG: hypothetical protein A3G69_03100 [Candidatus Peribacteria bacterium RIFCSPLOWO2_12_FULL_53_10]
MTLLRKKNTIGSSSACSVFCGLVTFLLLLTSLAAMMGVVNTHLTSSGIVFGGSGASLALLAFAINIAFCAKMLCYTCGHEKK